MLDLGARVETVSLDNFQLSPFVYHCKQDLRYLDVCEAITEGIEYCFHLAGIKASPDITNRRPATMSIPALQVNTNILEACRRNKVPKVLFTSSIGAYTEANILKKEDAYKGLPMDFYPGMVKRMAEYQINSYAKEFGLNYTIVRLANCYGPGDNFNPDNAMFIPSLMSKVLKNPYDVVIWGDGSAIRDFIYSKDAALGILKAMAESYSFANLGSGKGYSIREVVMEMLKIQPFTYRFDASKSSGVKKRVLEMDWFSAPTTLEKGLRETWNWFKENPKEYEGRLNYFVN